MDVTTTKVLIDGMMRRPTKPWAMVVARAMVYAVVEDAHNRGNLAGVDVTFTASTIPAERPSTST